MITIANTFDCKVTVGDSIENLLNYIPSEQHSKMVVVTDQKVFDLFHHNFPDAPVLVIGQSELNKNQVTINQLVTQLLDLGVDRHWFIVGIGGGIVCDVTGYLASIYMRGIPCGYLPSTLLAQVDASIGGKTGINFDGYKNIIGTFNQPQFVLCDQNLLQTLSENEIKNGLAEVIKHGIISSSELFDYVNNKLSLILKKDVEALTCIVQQCIQIKSEIVALDAMEKGERKKLNLGHTYGHAIESLEGIDHGHAVLKGLLLASEFSAVNNYCSWQTHVSIKQLLNQLDVSLVPTYSPKQMLAYINKDKKKRDNQIEFVYINEIGKTTVKSTPLNELIMESSYENA